MILLERHGDYVDILTSRKMKVTAKVDGVEVDVLPDYREDPSDTRCFGQWYIIECNDSQTIVINDEYIFSPK